MVVEAILLSSLIVFQGALSSKNLLMSLKILMVFSIIYLIRGGGFLFHIVSFIGGFLLLTHVISKSPSLKDSLLKFSDMLMPFKAGIGIALIVIGILGLF